MNLDRRIMIAAPEGWLAWVLSVASVQAGDLGTTSGQEGVWLAYRARSRGHIRRGGAGCLQTVHLRRIAFTRKRGFSIQERGDASCDERTRGRRDREFREPRQQEIAANYLCFECRLGVVPVPITTGDEFGEHEVVWL